MLSDTKFQGMDELLFLFSRLVKIRKGLQISGINVRDLDILIDNTVDEMCNACEIKPWKDGNKIHFIDSGPEDARSWSVTLSEMDISWSSMSNSIRLYIPNPTNPAFGEYSSSQVLVPDLPGTTVFLEVMNRSDAIQLIDKLSTLGLVRRVVLKTRDEMDVLYAIRPRTQSVGS
ncbi:MAG: hypothetical protein Q9180_009007 [Flavoplaca navasiana]